MSTLISLVAIAVLLILTGLMAYVRFLPVDVARWHVDLLHRPAEISAPSDDHVTGLPNGAYVDLVLLPADAKAVLAKLDATALATPRTRRIAGSVTTGHITWETRSLIWGFPDYTTAQITPRGVVLFARQRFGSSDWGVNATRLEDWLSRL